MTSSPSVPPAPPGQIAAQIARVLAVIDVGSTSVRMKIAQVHADGRIDTLETLQQTISIGKDTFTQREISRETIELCVKALRSFALKLREYGLDPARQLRAVATTAVREALNSQAFLDRIFIATGIEVEVLDEAEVARLTYHAAQSLIDQRPNWADSPTLVAEVGGGSTELLVLRGKTIEAARTFRVGSLRMREALETYRAPVGRHRQIMRNQAQRMVNQFRQEADLDGPIRLAVMGGDARFAAAHLHTEWDGRRPVRLDLIPLEALTDEILALSVDELVQKYRLSFPDAETLGPALLTFLELARGVGVDHLHVAVSSMRDGLISELASLTVWTPEFRQQVIRSAIELGRKYHFDEAHGAHVAARSRTLFQALADEHQLPPKFDLLLHVAAILHEVGLYISFKSHHKHSMYLIQNSELFGLGAKDLLLVALVARYHRRAAPKPTHFGYATLDRESRIAVAKLAAILRVADALERSHSQRVRSLEISRKPGKFIITVPDIDDLSIEQMAMRQKADMFEQTYGMRVVLRVGRTTHT